MLVLLRSITPPIWVGFAGLISAGLLGFAYYAEHVEYYLPCPLCLRQREVYWAVIAISITGLFLMKIRPTRRFADALALLIGLVFLTGAIVATYHAGAEFQWWPGPSTCSASDGGIGVVLDIDNPEGAASCLKASWTFLGLSMAVWNALVSAGLAIASFVFVRNPFARTV